MRSWITSSWGKEFGQIIHLVLLYFTFTFVQLFLSTVNIYHDRVTMHFIKVGLYVNQSKLLEATEVTV